MRCVYAVCYSVSMRVCSLLVFPYAEFKFLHWSMHVVCQCFHTACSLSVFPYTDFKFLYGELLRTTYGNRVARLYGVSLSVKSCGFQIFVWRVTIFRTRIYNIYVYAEA